MRFTHIGAVGLAALYLASCGKSGGEKAADAEPGAAVAGAIEEIEAPAVDPAIVLVETEKFLAENARKDGVVTTQSGLQYIVLEQGAGDEYKPVVEDLVDLDFVGTLKDGSEFDSSRARGASARFPLGMINVPGWVEGLQLMSEGDRYRFFIPPSLAYGAEGSGPIPPNEAIILDVTLKGISNPARNLKKSQAFLTENASAEGVQSTASGLQYKVMVEGDAGGAMPNEASVVKVHYKGTLIDGAEFDSSYVRGEPAEFPLANVIAGWTEGLQLMSEGDTFRFFVPPDLGYGANPRPGGVIGPNDALIFDVELIEVK